MRRGVVGFLMSILGWWGRGVEDRRVGGGEGGGGCGEVGEYCEFVLSVTGCGGGAVGEGEGACNYGKVE